MAEGWKKSKKKKKKREKYYIKKPANIYIYI